MALNIADIINVSWMAMMRAARKPYTFTSVRTVVNHPSYVTYLLDPASGASIPVVWSRYDEEKLITESDKIDFVHRLFTNAIETMDDLLAHRQNESIGEDVEEVIFE